MTAVSPVRASPISPANFRWKFLDLRDLPRNQTAASFTAENIALTIDQGPAGRAKSIAPARWPQ